MRLRSLSRAYKVLLFLSSAFCLLNSDSSCLLFSKIPCAFAVCFSISRLRTSSVVPSLLPCVSFQIRRLVSPKVLDHSSNLCSLKLSHSSFEHGSKFIRGFVSLVTLWSCDLGPWLGQNDLNLLSLKLPRSNFYCVFPPIVNGFISVSWPVVFFLIL